jgi:formate hydrogenlyase transcriptional activator
MAHNEAIISWGETLRGMNPSMGDKCSDLGFQEIVGESRALKHLLRLGMKAAGNDAPLLILGEAGSGKESIARAIHRISRRRKESFVKVNCAVAAEWLGVELFGDLTEARDCGKSGCLEKAHQGILFLDEIAHVPSDLQARLLRLLEHQEFERLDGNPGIRVNVRLIASTKYDLGEQVGEQTFLADLYDRLNVFPIRVPSLRERREDIPLLARYFMQMFARRMNKQIESIPAETMSFLMNSDWPGNIRQLENLIEQSVISTDGPALQVPLT